MHSKTQSSPLAIQMHSKKPKPSAQNHPFKRKHGKPSAAFKRKLHNKRPKKLIKNEENVDLEKALKRNKRRRPTKVVQATFPNFVMVMKRSHVSGCFWLGLPKEFCDEHMPKNDLYITLEDEEGIEHENKYLWKKRALSGGWRAFAKGHKLVENNVVTFQLIESWRFKVHISRTN